MAWVKLDDQFPLNSKTRAITVEARYLYVTSLCWCAMQMNDGTFPASDTETVAVLAGVPPTVAEQLSPQLWHQEGFDCEACAEVGQTTPVPSGHVAIHCYLERNESRAQVEERRRKDRKRKRASGEDSVRNPTVSSRPVPTSSSSRRPGNSRANGQQPDDDVPAAVWDHYAQLKLAQQSNVKNPGPWKTRTAANARTELGEQANTWWHLFDITPQRLAACLVDGTAPRNAKRKEPK